MRRSMAASKRSADRSNGGRTRRHARPERPNDAGTSAVELVITMPALLIAVLTVIQIALWMHAQHVALAAAQDGVRVARAYGGTEEDARARTLENLDRLGPSILRDRTVEVTHTENTATVTIRGTATSILGIFTLPVHERAQGPIERFIPASTVR